MQLAPILVFRHSKGTYKIELDLSWTLLEQALDGVKVFNGSLLVIVTVERHRDRKMFGRSNRDWLHVSVSRPPDTLPTYDDMVLVKELFIGAEISLRQNGEQSRLDIGEAGARLVRGMLWIVEEKEGARPATATRC